MLKKKLAVLISVLLILGSFTGCGFLQPSFADYNVSGYIQGLLDSSYHAEHSDFINFTNSTEAKAQENNDLTVENGAIAFCNGFNVFPSDTQLKELEDVFREAYRATKYTVKEKVESDTGYFIEVEMLPLLNIQNATAAIEQAREKASSGQLDSQIAQNRQTESSDEEDDYDNDYDEDYDSDDDSESSAESSSPNNFGSDYLDENTAFVDEVIKILKASIISPEYDTEQYITLDIRMDEEGVLSLDTVQIEQIDQTVVLLKPKS